MERSLFISLFNEMRKQRRRRRYRRRFRWEKYVFYEVVHLLTVLIVFSVLWLLALILY